MATFEKRSGKWRVLIRRKFTKTICKTFVTKEDADKYARETEAKIDKGLLVSYEEAQKTRFGELLERYRLEITSKKKSNETEDYKIKYLQTLPVADTLLISVTPTKIAKLRDQFSLFKLILSFVFPLTSIGIVFQLSFRFLITVIATIRIIFHFIVATHIFPLTSIGIVFQLSKRTC